MKKKSVTAGLLTFVVTLVVTVGIAVLYLADASSNRRERAQYIADAKAQTIEQAIANREYITRILEMDIAGNKGNISEEQFRIIGEELLDDHLDVVNATIAPDGIVSYTYPADSGIAQQANLFEDPALGLYADYSKMSGVPVIIAPVALLDGDNGIVITRPIFAAQDQGNKDFWGFASVTMKQTFFLTAVELGKLEEGGYLYKLVGNNMITNENDIIAENSEKELESPVSSMISTVGGSYWTLQISPMGHWMNAKEILASLAIAVVISVLAGLAMANYISMKANAKELEVLSYRDSLTNLYNPRSYQEHMEELHKKKLPYGLIFMDLNDFKQVNDTKGHDVGDALLNVVAKRLQNSIREKDRAFRIGGDEFVVVIHGNQDEKFLEGVIERMRQNVARDVVVGEITLKVSISAGYARCPEDGTKFEDVVKKADDAMYENKRLYKAKKKAEMEAQGLTYQER